MSRHGIAAMHAGGRYFAVLRDNQMTGCSRGFNRSH